MIAKKSASALPRFPSGKLETTMASAAGKRSAAPAPSTTRKVMIQASASLPSGVAPQSAEATVKMMTPTISIVRWPTMSEIRPPKANSAARASR